MPIGRFLKSILATLTIMATSLPGGVGATGGDATLVRTPLGAVSGQALGDVNRYLGIRYAAPPVGSRRWAPPEPVGAWNGVYAADRAGPPCPQPKIAPNRTSEDCLFLNVWVPRHHRVQERLPVMVWVYGGGFTSGSGADPMFDGSALARRGVIVVTLTYRINAAGFLPHPELTSESPQRSSGNYGLRDVIAAFEWVRSNIASFGGDPGRVTAFGESSGAILLTNLLVSAKGTGLFQQVILESGGQFRTYHPLDQAERLGATLGSLRQLRSADLNALPTLSTTEPASFPRPLFRPRMTGPIIDGDVITGNQRDLFESGRFLKMPILLGTNRDEGSYATRTYPVRTVSEYAAYMRSPATFGLYGEEALGLYPAATDADVQDAVAMSFADAQYNFGARQVARVYAAAGQPVYRYVFTRRAGGTSDGPNHGDEVPYVFNTLGTRSEMPYDADDQRLADLMTDVWARFARTGNPNGDSLPAWPRYQADTDLHLELGDRISVRSGYRSRQLDFIGRVQQMLRN